MAQGSRTRTNVINLDEELIGQRLSKPQKVYLFAREWTIRRDLDGEGIVQFWMHIEANKAADAFRLVLLDVGDEEVDEFSKKLLALPVRVYTRIFARLLAASGIRRGDEPEDTTGESTASSSES